MDKTEKEDEKVCVVMTTTNHKIIEEMLTDTLRAAAVVVLIDPTQREGLDYMQAAMQEFRDAIPIVGPQDKGKISDGYHTFDELYEHRHQLLALAMKFALIDTGAGVTPWVEDDPNTEGWFLAGFDTPYGQISYHLPDDRRPHLWYVEKIMQAMGYKREAYDGYTSSDVIVRLLNLSTVTPQEFAAVWPEPGVSG